jgi:hypothetical protein
MDITNYTPAVKDAVLNFLIAESKGHKLGNANLSVLIAEQDISAAVLEFMLIEFNDLGLIQFKSYNADKERDVRYMLLAAANSHQREGGFTARYEIIEIQAKLLTEQLKALQANLTVENASNVSNIATNLINMVTTALLRF